MYWIALANTNLYRIYSYENSTKAPSLTLLKEMSHPESKSRERELMTDRPGHYKTMGEARGTYSGHADPKEDEIDHFLHQLAEQFEMGRVANQYNKLILIAPPHVNGIISKHINKNVERLIISNLKKDYTHFQSHELSQFLHEHWKDLTKV